MPSDAHRPLSRAVAREAAQWLVRRHSGEFTEADARACEAWRAAQPEHERAWQRAQGLSDRLGLVPVAAGLQALGRPQRTDRRAKLTALAALLTAVPAGYFAWRGTPPWDGAWVADHRTATGERREVHLPDGSRVHLNTDTAFDVAFDDAPAGLRLIRLHRGEIRVETGSDEGRAPHRPFVVQTPEGWLRALGTRFIVRHVPGSGTAAAVTRLTVEEGAVEVRPRALAGEAPVIRAGQRTRFDDAAVAPAEPADPHAGAWVGGVFVARNLRLDEVLAELGRHRPGVLRCAPGVAHLRLTGAFQLHDTDAALAALPETLPVSVSYRTRWWVTVGEPAGGAARR